jgi:PAS domain S-box-containing protein
MLTGIIFVIDLNVPKGIAVGALYSVVILYSWLLPGRLSSIYTAAICSILVLITIALAPYPESTDHTAGVNRIISLVVIWVCASLVAISKRSFVELEQVKDGLEEQVKVRTKTLVSTQRKFENLLQNAPYAMVIVNSRGEIQLVNEQVENIFDYKQDELIGRKVETLIPERFWKDHTSHREGFFFNPKRRPMGEDVELWGVKKNGQEFPVEISLSPIHTDEGILVTAAIRDVTERKEARLRLENKNKELEQFAYIASHDLQEPLRTVTNFTDLLSKNYGEHFDEVGQKSMRFITEATGRMSQLIKGLLDYSRIGHKNETTSIDCNQLLEDIQKDLQQAISDSNASITVNKLPNINGHATELRLLFQNLITNAIKFRKSDVSPEIQISAQMIKGLWYFSVKDNGIGIADEHKERIFTIFQRLNSDYSGTGIGLAHSRKIVELHGGTLWVESELHQGSTFYFTLPS